MNEPIVIPGYRTIRELGAGGMAMVHLAIQESFDREVALKIMSPMFNIDPSFATRFVREARIISQIHHASIVPVHDVGEHRRHQYLSMEYLPGGDLKHRLQTRGPDAQQALTVCRAISSALELAHRKGFVHRDIKPENILFREDGTPVLTDFGIARAIDSGTSLTRVGTLVGTPAYMSPEQIKGLELDGRSDLYSLGIVLYEMLTGSQPFRADSTLSLALKHISEPLPTLPSHMSHFQRVLDRLTARERDERFANGAEVMEALDQIERAPRNAPIAAPVRNPTPMHIQTDDATQLREMPPVEAAPNPPPLLPRSIRLLWIGLGTAAITGAVAMTYMTSRPETEPGMQSSDSPAAVVTPASVTAQTAMPPGMEDPMQPAPAASVVATIAPKATTVASSAAKPDAAPVESVSGQSTSATRATRPAKMDVPKRQAVAKVEMPSSKDAPMDVPAPLGALQIPLNLIDHALWGEEQWRDAAEPEKIARFVQDDIKIRSLEMYAQDLGNGVARLGVRGKLANGNAHDRLVKLRIELVNGGQASLPIPLEDIEIDGEEEEEFEHTLDIAASNINASAPTRVRVTLSAVDH